MSSKKTGRGRRDEDADFSAGSASKQRKQDNVLRPIQQVLRTSVLIDSVGGESLPIDGRKVLESVVEVSGWSHEAVAQLQKDKGLAAYAVHDLVVKQAKSVLDTFNNGEPLRMGLARATFMSGNKKNNVFGIVFTVVEEDPITHAKTHSIVPGTFSMFTNNKLDSASGYTFDNLNLRKGNRNKVMQPLLTIDDIMEFNAQRISVLLGLDVLIRLENSFAKLYVSNVVGLFFPPGTDMTPVYGNLYGLSWYGRNNALNVAMLVNALQTPQPLVKEFRDSSYFPPTLVSAAERTQKDSGSSSINAITLFVVSNQKTIISATSSMASTDDADILRLVVDAPKVQGVLKEYETYCAETLYPQTKAKFDVDKLAYEGRGEQDMKFPLWKIEHHPVVLYYKQCSDASKDILVVNAAALLSYSIIDTCTTNATVLGEHAYIFDNIDTASISKCVFWKDNPEVIKQHVTLVLQRSIALLQNIYDSNIGISGAWGLIFAAMAEDTGSVIEKAITRLEYLNLTKMKSDFGAPAHDPDGASTFAFEAVTFKRLLGDLVYTMIKHAIPKISDSVMGAQQRKFINHEPRSGVEYFTEKKLWYMPPIMTKVKTQSGKEKTRPIPPDFPIDVITGVCAKVGPKSRFSIADNIRIDMVDHSGAFKGVELLEGVKLEGVNSKLVLYDTQERLVYVHVGGVGIAVGRNCGFEGPKRISTLEDTYHQEPTCVPWVLDSNVWKLACLKLSGLAVNPHIVSLIRRFDAGPNPDTVVKWWNHQVPQIAHVFLCAFGTTTEKVVEYQTLTGKNWDERTKITMEELVGGASDSSPYSASALFRCFTHNSNAWIEPMLKQVGGGIDAKTLKNELRVGYPELFDTVKRTETAYARGLMYLLCRGYNESDTNFEGVDAAHMAAFREGPPMLKVTRTVTDAGVAITMEPNLMYTGDVEVRKFVSKKGTVMFFQGDPGFPVVKCRGHIDFSLY